jgi:hypothetical protein
LEVGGGPTTVGWQATVLKEGQDAQLQQVVEMLLEGGDPEFAQSSWVF